MKNYMVIGVWEDDHGRFAASYTCSSPEEAEMLAIEEYVSDDAGNLVIAGVLTGDNMEVVA